MIFLAAARDSEMIRWTRGLQREPVVDWQEILARFDLPCEYRGEGES